MDKKKYFIITVDTEGDNLWKYEEGNEVTTRNTKYLYRFQELCERFGFIPTYLTNYEVAMDDEWIAFSKEKALHKKCEIGLHLHAWNSPPEYELQKKYNGNPYITEYPLEVMEAKVEYLKNMLEEKYGFAIFSHRSGRWATNHDYFSVLKKSGIKYDCSYVPGLDLSGISGYSQNCGNNYKQVKNIPHMLDEGIFEIPMSTSVVRRLGKGSIKHRVKNLVVGEEIWLRPHTKSLNDLIMLSNHLCKKGISYLEFMIHSSELMPGGSPYFKNDAEIELLYEIMEQYFSFLKKNDYHGIRLMDFGEMCVKG